MNRNPLWSFLRLVLAVDALSSAAMGLGLVSASGLLAAWTSLPAPLLFESGLVLLPFAAFVAFLATRAEPPRAGVWIVIALNAIWTVASIALLFADWTSPNLLGSIFIAAQAAVVGVFAELQYVGMRKGRVVAA
jgi:hypothetical protein